MGTIRRVVGHAPAWAAWLLVAIVVSCAGSDDQGSVLPGPDVTPDVAPEVTPSAPACDPVAEPTGCEEGALCWYGACAAVSRTELTAPASARIGAVASLADGAGGAAVAWHERRITTAADGSVTAREDVVMASFLQDDALGAPIEVARWDVPAAEADAPGPRLALLRTPDGGVTVVRGPEPLVTHRWQGGGWVAGDPLETGARLIGSEGTFAAVYDPAGRLHVAWHDTRSASLDIATLDAGGAWSQRPVVDLTEHYGQAPWGSRIAAANLGDRVVFAHVLASELDATVRRGAVVVDQVSGGWDVTTPSLGQGLVIEGRVMAIAATVDDAGHLTLAWLPHTRQIGVAVRGDDGEWTAERYLDASDTNISEDVFDNLAVRWWQDALLFAWIGYPERECSCFDVRLAMVRDGAWLEYRVERFPDYGPAALSLSVDGDGRALLPVGGGPFTNHGTTTPLVFTSALPDWTAP